MRLTPDPVLHHQHHSSTVLSPEVLVLYDSNELPENRGSVTFTLHYVNDFYFPDLQRSLHFGNVVTYNTVTTNEANIGKYCVFGTIQIMRKRKSAVGLIYHHVIGHKGSVSLKIEKKIFSCRHELFIKANTGSHTALTVSHIQEFIQIYSNTNMKMG